MANDEFLQNCNPSLNNQAPGMRILWKYLKPHKGLIIVSLLSALLAQLLPESGIKIDFSQIDFKF